MIENVFPPIPSEVILTFGGFLTTYTSMNVWGVVLSAMAGSVMDAIILYIIGRVLNANRLAKLCDSKVGRLIHLKKDALRKAETWFLKHDSKAIFICRFVPIVRSLISIPAGTTKMKILPFLIYTTVGTFIWNVVLVFLGRFAGSAWQTIAGYFDVYAKIALAVFLLIAIVVGIIFVKKRFLNNKD